MIPGTYRHNSHTCSSVCAEFKNIVGSNASCFFYNFSCICQKTIRSPTGSDSIVRSIPILQLNTSLQKMTIFLNYHKNYSSSQYFLLEKGTRIYLIETLGAYMERNFLKTPGNQINSFSLRGMSSKFTRLPVDRIINRISNLLVCCFEALATYPIIATSNILILIMLYINNRDIF